MTESSNSESSTSESPRLNSWNENVIAQFRAGDQRIADMFDRSQLLILHTVGAKSGQPRVSPLVYFPIDGTIAIVASAGGQPKHPAWYFNLVAQPRVTVERWADDAIESFEATATQVEGEEYDQLMAKITAAAPQFAEYQTKTDRKIPVILLNRA